MAQTLSTMLPLGTKAPAFALPGLDGRSVRLADFSDAKALLVMFICNHCPFVKHVAAELAALGKTYQAQGVAVIAINSNDADKYPDDAPDKMKLEHQLQGYTFPYLFDATQQVAITYQAACTPDFYVFGQDQRLMYRGQLDDSRPGNGKAVTGGDLRLALDAVLAGQAAPAEQRPSIGCNIKWRAGVAPAYFQVRPSPSPR